MKITDNARANGKCDTKRRDIPGGRQSLQAYGSQQGIQGGVATFILLFYFPFFSLGLII